MRIIWLHVLNERHDNRAVMNIRHALSVSQYLYF